METILIYCGIMGALLAGAVSPGASFILVCRTAMVKSRSAGLASALGMGAGGAIFAVLALAGLAALLTAVPAVHVGLKIGGGLYLMYLAFRIWGGARQPLAMGAGDAALGSTNGKVFWVALATQLSNPKTAIVYSSIFSAFLPSMPSLGLILVLVPGVFLVEFGWYAMVAVFFSLARPRQAYLSSKTTIDRIVALVLGALGARLLHAGVTSLASERY